MPNKDLERPSQNAAPTRLAFPLNIRFIRRIWQGMERFPPFFKVCFSKRGLWNKDGRSMIWGKFRRVTLSFFPWVAIAVQKHYGLQGGCEHCSSSCKLLFQCPHWDDQSSRCSVYEDRPNICRYFPMSPGDIRDRNLVSPKIPCGFTFKKP